MNLIKKGSQDHDFSIFNHIFHIKDSYDYRVRKKVNILEKIEPLEFVRIHKSYIINKVHIKIKSSNEVCMKSNASILVGNKCRLKILSKESKTKNRYT